MEQPSKAFVLHTIKYGETSVILHCYTQRHGVRAFIVKGVRSAKRNKAFSMGMFQPLTQLEVVATTPKRSGLSVLKSAKITNPYTTVNVEITKSSVCMFLAEVLRSVLNEEEENLALYAFLEHAFYWLDTQEQTANFHLFVLIHLTKYLGFFPEVTSVSYPYFDLQSGQFSEHAESKDCIGGGEIVLLKQYLGIKFDRIQTVLVSSEQRRKLLNVLLQYYHMHIQEFKTPKSLEVLYEVFHK